MGFVQALFITNSFVSIAFSVPEMLITVYCCVKTFTSYKLKGTILVFSLLFIVLSLYGIIAILFGDAGGYSSYSFLLMVIVMIGPIIAFYYFSKKNMLDEKKLKFWFVVFLVVAIVHFYDLENRRLAKLMSEGISVEEITNNAAYFVLGLFPFVFLFQKKPVIQYVLVGIIMFYVVMGMKRGALLVAIVLLLWFVIVSNRTASRSRKFFIIGLTLALIIIGYQFIVQFYDSSEYFQQRVEDTMEGSSSGRDVIYSNLWNHFLNNDNFFQLLFGEGANATVKVSTMSAHNDWLELLIDCGVLTVFLYFIYYLCFFWQWRKSKNNPLLFQMIGACFIYVFLRTFFSMSIIDMPFHTSMIMGYCLAQVFYGNEVSKMSDLYA